MLLSGPYKKRMSCFLYFLALLCMILPTSLHARQSVIATTKVTPVDRKKIDELLLEADKAKNFQVMTNTLVSLLESADWLNLQELELRLRELKASAYLIAIPVNLIPNGLTTAFYFHEDFLQESIKIPPYFLWVAVNGQKEAGDMMREAKISDYADNINRLRITGFLTTLTDKYPKIELHPNKSNIPKDKEKSEIYRVLGEYVKNGYTDKKAAHIISKVINDFLVKSGSNRRFSVNNLPDMSLVNVYAINSDPGRHFEELECNCGYIPGTSAIVCDSKFLNKFQNIISMDNAVPVLVTDRKLNSVKPPIDSDLAEDSIIKEAVTIANNKFSYFLLQWVLGHELGHLILNHDFETNYFDSHTMLSRASRIPPKVRREFEVAADEFSIQYLSNTDEFFYAWLGLSNVISSLYGNVIKEQYTREGIIGRQIDPIRTQIPVKILDTKNSHPPLLYRSVELANVVLKLHKEIVDTSGHFDKVKQNLFLTNDGIPSANICSMRQ